MNLLEQAETQGITGFLHPAELEKLAELATGRDVLEIGSYRGLSAWGMAQTAKTVTCVDTFRAWTNGQTQNTIEEGLTTFDAFLRAVQGFSNVYFYQGTSEAIAGSWTELQRGRQFDMIFLDAMHTYEDVKADILRWMPHLREGGIMAFHDYGHGDFPGVKQAVDELITYPPDEEPLITLAWWTKR